MSLVRDEFSQIRSELDARNDKFERVVKLSRDIVIESKRIISLLHRQYKKVEALDEAHERLIKLRQSKFNPMAKELQNEDPYYFLRAYSFGLQEYIEAVSFWTYLHAGKLVTLDEVQEGLIFQEKITISSDYDECQTRDEEDNVYSKKEKVVFLQVFVPEYDFLLGVLDLGGEMMRACVSAKAANNHEFTKKFCRLVQDLLRGVEACHCWHREFSSKAMVLKASTGKMERCCYQLTLQRKESSSFLFDGRNKNEDAYDSGLD